MASGQVRFILIPKSNIIYCLIGNIIFSRPWAIVAGRDDVLVKLISTLTDQNERERLKKEGERLIESAGSK